MVSPDPEGPDGSSIKPVSSLLAKFENMNKLNDAPPALAQRAVSPGMKPERSREAMTANAREPPAIPKKAKPTLTLGSCQPPNANAHGRSLTPGSATSTDSLNRPVLAPTLTPRLIPTPSLQVDPPHSPPKKKLESAASDRPTLLATDNLSKPLSPCSLRQVKATSRPHTPIFEAIRSPRLGPSNPPSPPPPRRSAELRASDRDTREQESIAHVGRVPRTPPPVIWSERPVSVRNSYVGGKSQVMELSQASMRVVSPFGSPPSSAGSPEEGDVPPMPPVRPRPSIDGPRRSQAIFVELKPPTVHRSMAKQWREREEASINSLAAPLVPVESRPALPGMPLSLATAPQTPNAAAMPPPPRPPRPGITSQSLEATLAPVCQKRVASTPTSRQFAPPPSRTHGRSMTVDRASSRVPAEFRLPPVAGEGEGHKRSPPSRPMAVSNSHTSTDHLRSTIGGQAKPEASTMTFQAPANQWPDSSNTSRNMPLSRKGVHEIATKYDSRLLDVCGELVCTTGAFTRVWNLLDGDLLMSLAMGESIKGMSVAFKPGANVDEEGTRVWIGNNLGELVEADILSQNMVNYRPQSHGRNEIIKIYRHYNELWTLDEAGTLHVWGPDPETHVPTLDRGPNQSYRLPRAHVFSMVVGDELWHATGKEIRVFMPTVDGRQQFQVLMRPLSQDGAAEVTSGTLISSQPDKAFFGHKDGKVSIYSRKDYACLTVVALSSFKINSLTGVGPYIWAGHNTGRVSVFDIKVGSDTPPILKKDWQAHANPVVKLIADQSSCYRLDRFQVVSLGADNMVRAWDGLLQDDWLEGEMKATDRDYCDFDTLRALVLTWNAGASTPHSLRYSDGDANFFQELLQNSDSPDILIFGFQELVDLEDKTATAKRFLKVKKKEGSDQERMSHQYRDWRDSLQRSLDDYMAGELYHLLHVAPMVGLFTCIFVKADLRSRITNLSCAEVKRGMGGLHGNKGAVLVRFLIDDTSLCLVNCHLAAGQSNANHRHNDIAAILEASPFPGQHDPLMRIDSFASGGDGTMVLDHELCILNGDLNYRIDTMSRDTVVAAVKSGNLSKLLERDQLLVARRRNPAFRLRAFEERPIDFAPTYKYDVGTDNYDSSEKKRSPAWCDRLLFRADRQRIEQLDYQRHEVRVSDHRPVSGRFRIAVKRVRPKDRAATWTKCQQRWEYVREQAILREKLYYLSHIIGYDDETAQRLVKDRPSKRDHRSPQRSLSHKEGA